MTTDEMNTTENPYNELYEDDDDDYTVTPVSNTSRARRVTTGLFVLLILGGAFWGGAYAQKHWGSNSSSTSNIASQFAAAARSRTGGGTTGATGAGGFGGGGTGGGATTGSVTLVDGNNIYVTETSGNVVKVVTSQASTFTKSDSGTINDVKPGQTVSVRGSTDSSGNVDATSVSIGGATAAGAAATGN
jgi:hypothetical protein